MTNEYTQRFGKGKNVTGFSRTMLDEAMNYHETMKMRKVEISKNKQKNYLNVP